MRMKISLFSLFAWTAISVAYGRDPAVNHDVTSLLNNSIARTFRNLDSEAIADLLVFKLDNVDPISYDIEIDYDSEPFRNKFHFTGVNISIDLVSEPVFVRHEFTIFGTNVLIPKLEFTIEGYLGSTNDTVHSRFLCFVIFKNISLTIFKIAPYVPLQSKLYFTLNYDENFDCDFLRLTSFNENLTSDARAILKHKIKEAVPLLFLENLQRNERFSESLDTKLYTHPEKEIASLYPDFRNNSESYHYFIPDITSLERTLDNITIAGLWNFQCHSVGIHHGQIVRNLTIKNIRGQANLSYDDSPNSTIFPLRFEAGFVSILVDEKTQRISVTTNHYSVSQIGLNSSLTEHQSKWVMGGIELAIASSIMPSAKFYRNANFSSITREEHPLVKISSTISHTFRADLIENLYRGLNISLPKQTTIESNLQLNSLNYNISMNYSTQLPLITLIRPYEFFCTLYSDFEMTSVIHWDTRGNFGLSNSTHQINDFVFSSSAIFFRLTVLFNNFTEHYDYELKTLPNLEHDFNSERYRRRYFTEDQIDEIRKKTGQMLTESISPISDKFRSFAKHLLSIPHLDYCTTPVKMFDDFLPFYADHELPYFAHDTDAHTNLLFTSKINNVTITEWTMNPTTWIDYYVYENITTNVQTTYDDVKFRIEFDNSLFSHDLMECDFSDDLKITNFTNTGGFSVELDFPIPGSRERRDSPLHEYDNRDVMWLKERLEHIIEESFRNLTEIAISPVHDSDPAVNNDITSLLNDSDPAVDNNVTSLLNNSDPAVNNDITSLLNNTIATTFRNLNSGVAADSLVFKLDNSNPINYDIEVDYDSDFFQNKFYFIGVNISTNPLSKFLPVRQEFSNFETITFINELEFMIGGYLGATNDTTHARFYCCVILKNVWITASKISPLSEESKLQFDMKYDEKFECEFLPLTWFPATRPSEAQFNLKQKIKNAVPLLFLENLQHNERFSKSFDTIFFTHPKNEIASIYSDFLDNSEDYHYFIPSITSLRRTLSNITITGLWNFHLHSVSVHFGQIVRNLRIKNIRGQANLSYDSPNSTIFPLRFEAGFVSILVDKRMQRISVTTNNYSVSQIGLNSTLTEHQSKWVMGGIELAIATSIMPSVKFCRNANFSSITHEEHPIVIMSSTISRLFQTDSMQKLYPGLNIFLPPEEMTAQSDVHIGFYDYNISIDYLSPWPTSHEVLFYPKDFVCTLYTNFEMDFRLLWVPQLNIRLSNSTHQFNYSKFRINEISILLNVRFNNFTENYDYELEIEPYSMTVCNLELYAQNHFTELEIEELKDAVLKMLPSSILKKVTPLAKHLISIPHLDYCTTPINMFDDFLPFFADTELPYFAHDTDSTLNTDRFFTSKINKVTLTKWTISPSFYISFDTMVSTNTAMSVIMKITSSQVYTKLDDVKIRIDLNNSSSSSDHLEWEVSRIQINNSTDTGRIGNVLLFSVGTLSMNNSPLPKRAKNWWYEKFKDIIEKSLNDR